MVEKTKTVTFKFPYSLYKKIKKEKDRREDHNEEFVAVNTLVVEALEKVFK